MSILRKVNREHYTTIENDILEDERLSYRARGIAVYLLSKPDEWTINMKHLARNGREGLGAIRTALHELAEYGYIKRTRQHKNGHVVTVTLIADFPAFAEDGTTEERINGYELTEQEPDIQEPDLSKTDMSETDKSDPDMSETDRSLVNTDVVNTDVVNTDKEKEFPETATTNNNQNANGLDPPSDLEASARNAFELAVLDLQPPMRNPGQTYHIDRLGFRGCSNGDGDLRVHIGVDGAEWIDWMQSHFGRHVENVLCQELKRTVALEWEDAEP